MRSFIRTVVPCQLRFRDGVGSLLSTLCGMLDEQTMFQIVSAFNEVFNNVVHHSKLAPEAPVEVEASLDTDRVTVRVMDAGVAFDQEVVDSRAAKDWEVQADSLPEGGLGFLIIHKCMDEVTYERNTRNVLTMVKHLA